MGATISNPLWNATGAVPGGNPTGVAIPFPGMSSSSGTTGATANPYTPTPSTNMSPSAPMSNNPFAAGAVPGATTSATPNVAMPPPALPTSLTGAVPGTPTASATPGAPSINSGGFTSTGGSLLPTTGTNATGGSASDPFGFGSMTPKDQSRMFDSLKKTYGDGMAHMLMNFLQSGAGYNQSAINNMLASLQPGIERGQENLMEQFSASGNRFGSGAQIGLGDYLSQVNLNEGQLVSQMYESALQNYMNVMMGTANTDAGRIANSPSTMDSIMGGLGLASTGAGALADAGVGSAGGGVDSVLAGLAAV